MKNIDYQNCASLIEAKGAARKYFKDQIAQRSEKIQPKLNDDELEFSEQDYVLQVVEFFVLLNAYEIRIADQLAQFAKVRNKTIENQIDELRKRDLSAGIKAARISDLKRGIFSDSAISRLKMNFELYQGLEQASLARFVSGFMSETWTKRSLAILAALELLEMHENSFGGKVFVPKKELYDLYLGVTECFSGKWAQHT